MTPSERDDVIYALNQTQAFFGKTLDDLQLKFWMRALKDYSAAEIKRGLADYTGIGKYAPKPVDIAELIKNNRETDRRADNKPRELPPIREADEATAKAWQYVIKLWGLNLFNVGKVDSETAEAYILLCNRQAKGNNNPTSIPPEAWRADIWGCEREAMV